MRLIHFIIYIMRIVIVIISNISFRVSSPSLTDPNYLQNQESNLDTSLEIETKETPPSPSPSQFIKKILVVDDDPDLTLTFKVGLEGYHYDEKKRFEVYTYNDPLLVLKEFKPHFYRSSSNRYLYAIHEWLSVM